MVASIVITSVGFERAKQRLDMVNHTRIVRGVKFFTRQRLKENLKTVKEEAPVGETRELSNKIRLVTTETADSVSGEYIADAKHARWVVRGTGIRSNPPGQIIRPRTRKYMVFFKEGVWKRIRFSRGQYSNNFMDRAGAVIRRRLLHTIPIDMRRDIEVLVSGVET